MKARRSSPRKRCLWEASSPDEISEQDDSAITSDSIMIENRRLKRVSTSPSLTSACPSQQCDESQLRQVPQDNKEDNCDDDEEEVEFLRTNPPTHAMDTSMKCIHEEKVETVTPRKKSSTSSEHHHDTKNSGMKFDEPPVKNGTPSTATRSPISSFPHVTSAYLQSLAEISHAVLWDGRWRVGGSHQYRLFTWEQGDDMNALYKLSRRYIQPSSLKQRSRYRSTRAFKSNEHDAVSSIGVDNDKEKEDVEITSGDSNVENFVDDYSDDKVQEPRESNVECEPDDRCLETFSRLYFRKGPWFRLDNIYKSYYVPKKFTEPSPQKTDISTDTESNAPALKRAESPSKFFRRRNKGHQNCQEPKTTREDDYIDQEFVDLQMENVIVLLRDIKRLFDMGLIRSFVSEEECGRTIGRRRERYDFAASSLLRLDEQRTVLAKLGGGQKQKNHSASGSRKTNSHASSTAATFSEQQQQPLENLIWKQMCQQQTIFHSFKNGRNSTVLPVIKHLHKILVEKWAAAFIYKASKVEYIPSPILRSATKKVYDILMDLTCKSDITSTIMCFRLREAPVRTLQRACRLYLCATSGPGDMRNNGTDAWRSLPESHTKDFRNIPLRTNSVSPPGSSWNTVRYPGKDWRLKVASFNFINAFKPMVTNELCYGSSIIADEAVIEKGEKNDKLASQMMDTSNRNISYNLDDIQVFSSVQAFHQWEAGVELRENCDFLLELNELILYNERKQGRGTKNNIKSDDVDSDDHNSGIDKSSSEDDNAPAAETKVDFLDLLTIAGRAKTIRGLLALKKNDCRAIISEIERDISLLLAVPFGDRPLSSLIVSTATEIGSSRFEERSHLENECERILGVIGIILTHILEFRNSSIDQVELAPMIKRPWLRHMCWEGCMSYVLWDVIPILERRGYYQFAISALEVVLFGRRLPRSKNEIIPDNFVVGPEKNQDDVLHSYQPLISRRARGKALDRLIIDYTHFVRKNGNTSNFTKPKMTQTSVRPKQKLSPKSITSEVVKLLTEPLIRSSVASGKMTFSSIRTLARRLKRPLSCTLQGLQLFESGELGLRLSNSNDRQQELTKYNDWSPITDTAVANAMANDRDSIGGRCSFVGFEEDEDAVHMGSLNVEELAKEYYHQGRLPANDESPTKGGWIGYHDEGGKIRLLFRILSFSVLGMDWNTTGNSIPFTSEASTIHLTPYQGAPFDLHVGAEHVDTSEVGCRGIYMRRKSSIDNFLGKLSNLDDLELATFVYDCVARRVHYTNSLNRQDLMLESDLKQVRTLSMIAAGFGGKMLASIFRCFFFDYRHYSGGLPDLLLVRALYMSPSNEQSTGSDPITGELVDLGEWIGEEFSSENQEAVRAKQIARIFMDTDSDFLGCSKVGDSGGRATNRFHRSGQTRHLRGGNKNISKDDDAPNAKDSKTPYAMPEKLSLSHNSRPIRVECMFVEVKSQSDRLDSRQEDWLNVLDQHGNARVCKFEKAPKRERKAIVSKK